MKPANVPLAPLARISDGAAIEKFCAKVPTVLFDGNLEGLGVAFVGADGFSFVSQTVDYTTRTGEAICGYFFSFAVPLPLRERAQLLSTLPSDLSSKNRTKPIPPIFF